MSQPGSGQPDEDELPDFLAGDTEVTTTPDRADLASLRRRLADADLSAAMAAVDDTKAGGHGELQVALTDFFFERAEHLDHGDVERLLDCLAELGDGRCVRGMERVLHQRWQHLSEHQAWRGRHIVQLIRRGGRK